MDSILDSSMVLPDSCIVAWLYLSIYFHDNLAIWCQWWAMNWNIIKGVFQSKKWISQNYTRRVVYVHRVQKKRCHWFFRCNFYKYWRTFIIFSCTTSQENSKVTGVKISCHTFVMLLPCRVKVSDTKVTHSHQYWHFANVYIDHIYENQYRWNKQNTAESQGLKIYVQNVHHSRKHMHSNDYATAQSLMVSAAVSSLGATQLHFLETGLRSTVNITGIQFCWICFFFILLERISDT